MMSKPQASGLRKLLNSTRYSFQGFASAWRNEEAFRLECGLFVLLAPLALLIGENLTHTLLLLLSLSLVILAEVINTALESVVDRISQDHHPLAGQAKDLGSAAVFVTLSIVAMVWLPSLWRYFAG